MDKLTVTKIISLLDEAGLNEIREGTPGEAVDVITTAKLLIMSFSDIKYLSEVQPGEGKKHAKKIVNAILD